MQMEEQGNEFLVELEKLMPSQIAMTAWANNMDLLAIVTFDNYLQLFRISYKAQLVFQQEESQAIKCLAFSLDSHFIAYGLLDGSIKILKTENGEKVTIVENLQRNQIEALSFRPYHTVDPKCFMAFQKNSMEGKLILPVSPHKNCNKNAIIKINYFNELSQDFVFLLSSQKNRTVLLLNGFIPVAQIDYTDVNLQNFKVHHTHYDNNFKAIVTQQTMGNFKVHLIQYESTILNQYYEDIIKYHCIVGYVTELLNFVDGTFPAMEMILREISSNYNSKMGQIDDSSVQGINPCEELFRFLNLGITSAPLVNFFSKSLYDSKVPQKLDQSLTVSFAKLHDILLESTQNSLQRAVILLHRLKSMAYSHSFDIFGITESDIQLVIGGIKRLYTMTQVLLVESTQTKFDIRNLLVWLNKSAIKTSQENDTEIENTKSYLNKYTVDFTRLHQFLSSQNKFSLDHLKFFFNKSDQTRGMNIQTPEFRLLHRDKGRVNPQLDQNFKNLEKLLQVQDVIAEQQDISSIMMNGEFKSFKKQMLECKNIWKSVVQKPIKSISKKIQSRHSISHIGEIEFNQLFPIEILQTVIQNELIIYFVERKQEQDWLIKYNCDRKTRQHLKTKCQHIVSLAKGQNLLVVLQQKMSGQKMVGQVVNQRFDGSEIEIGRRISRVNGEVDINGSLRGLNSLVQNKTKLIIFD